MIEKKRGKYALGEFKQRKKEHQQKYLYSMIFRDNFQIHLGNKMVNTVNQMSIDHKANNEKPNLLYLKVSSF